MIQVCARRKPVASTMAFANSADTPPTRIPVSTPKPIHLSPTISLYGSVFQYAT